MHNKFKVLIIGGGLAGISTSYHIGHKKCKILEASDSPYGTAKSEIWNGFYWDVGPHVSFTKSKYVQNLFKKNLKILENDVVLSNYFYKRWVPHPAQYNLWAFPDKFKEQCLESYKNSANQKVAEINYGVWLRNTFGIFFANELPERYTLKYWTVPADQMTTDWIGPRMKKINLEEISLGADRPQNEKNYIQSVRYPSNGGFQEFARDMYKGACIELNTSVTSIDLSRNSLTTRDGDVLNFDFLVNTIPLDKFVKLCNAPAQIVEASTNLLCTSVLLVDIVCETCVEHAFDWFYVYDSNLYSTRVSKAKPTDSTTSSIGLQVEVYLSAEKELNEDPGTISMLVVEELISMGIVGNVICYRHRIAEYANVVFTEKRKSALNAIFEWFGNYGLAREDDDLDYTTNWCEKKKSPLGNLIFAGRYAQWNYYWSDDCVLRGKYISECIDNLI